MPPLPLSRRTFCRTSLAAAPGLALSGLPAPLWSESPSAPAARPNLLFIMADQWRRPALGFRREDPVETPHLDRFASAALSCDHAFAASPVCSPNRACLLTGLHIQSHGVLTNNAKALDPALPNLGNVLHSAGYRTGYIGKWHLDGGPPSAPTPAAHHRHFDFFYKSHGHTHGRLRYQVGPDNLDLGLGWQPDHETDQAIAFLRPTDPRPFALVVSYNPPHNGSNPEGLLRRSPGDANEHYSFWAPPAFEARYAHLSGQTLRPNYRLIPSPHHPSGFDDPSALAAPGYWGAITSIDANLGRLLTALEASGQADNTLVVFTSDHGEMLGSHGLMTKGVFFEESLGVPLLFRFPGRIPPGTSPLLFSSVDLFPTLLSLLGLPPPPTDGRNLAPFLTGAPGSASPPEHTCVGLTNWRGLRTSRYAYVTSTGKTFTGREAKVFGPGRNHALFDKQADPYQLQPIFLGASSATDRLIADFHDLTRSHYSALGENFLPPSPRSHP